MKPYKTLRRRFWERLNEARHCRRHDRDRAQARRRRLLEDRIYEFNVQATGTSDGKLLAVFLRDDAGAVVGGIYGWTWGAACYIRHLYVPAHLRHQGHGSRLMRRVEAEAAARQCRQIVLDTHDFQAPDFYRRLGFEVVGRVDDYPRGHQSLTMVKRLAPSCDDT